MTREVQLQVEAMESYVFKERNSLEKVKLKMAPMEKEIIALEKRNNTIVQEIKDFENDCQALTSETQIFNQETEAAINETEKLKIENQSLEAELLQLQYIHE